MNTVHPPLRDTRRGRDRHPRLVAQEDRSTRGGCRDGNLRELAATRSARAARRAFASHRFLPPIGVALGDTRALAEIPAGARPSPPPPVTLGFTSGTSRQLSPADASGAVGPNHVVGAYNDGIIVHDRSGKVLSAVTLTAVLGDVSDASAINTTRASPTTPSRDRWVMMAVDRRGGAAVRRLRDGRSDRSRGGATTRGLNGRPSTSPGSRSRATR